MNSIFYYLKSLKILEDKLDLMLTQTDDDKMAKFIETKKQQILDKQLFYLDQLTGVIDEKI